MYIRSPKNNINLAELMQQGKAIFFKLPQNRFSSPLVKNIMVSYLFSKNPNRNHSANSCIFTTCNFANISEKSLMILKLFFLK